MVTIFTDGSSGNRTGKDGGCAAVILHNGKMYQIQVGYSNTSVSRMELRAAIHALDALNCTTIPVTIYSDSQYVVRGIDLGKAAMWQLEKYDFGTDENGKPVLRPNHDLWDLLLYQVRRFKRVKFMWVKGHDGNKYNEMCDRLAKQAKGFTEKTKDL